MSTAIPRLCAKCGNPADHTCVWENGRAYHVECAPSYDPRAVLCSIRAALSQEREAREKAERERDEARQSWKEAVALYEQEVARVDPLITTVRTAEASLAEARRLLTAVVEAKALEGVRKQVAGWNGEGRDDGYRYERHRDDLGAKLPDTNCGAIYALDEAMQEAALFLSQEQPR